MTGRQGFRRDTPSCRNSARSASWFSRYELLPIYLFVNLFIYLYIYLSLYLPVSLHLFEVWGPERMELNLLSMVRTYLSIYLFISPIYLFIYLFIYIIYYLSSFLELAAPVWLLWRVWGLQEQQWYF